MKPIYVLLAFVIFCLFNHCTNQKVDEGISSLAATHLSCKFEYDTTDIFSLVDRIQYIPLQTNEQSIIGNITHIRYYQNKYFIVDGQQQKILVFNEQGDYMATIGQKGNGPCQFYDIYDLFVKNDSLEVLAQPNPVQIIRYSLDFQACNEIKFKSIVADKFIPLNGGYVFYNPSGAERKEDQYFLNIADSSGQSIAKNIPSHPYTGYMIGQADNFCKYEDIILFYMPMDNNIYQMDRDGEISIRYVMDFGKYQLPEHIKRVYEKNLQKYIELSEGYVDKIFNFYETRFHLMFSYMNTNEGVPFYALYSKENKVMRVLTDHDEITGALLNPIGMTDDTFISFVEPSLFDFDNDPDYKAVVAKRYPDFIPFIESMSANDNPILIRYTMKAL